MSRKKTIEYPVSTKYRENWGEWEAIREIVQNAMDTGTKVVKRYDADKGTLIVKDSGEGFALKNLLIGEGDKDGKSSIGKFHEGMKFALLVCARDNIKVKIQTNNTVIVPRLTKMFEQEVLAIDYWEAKDSIKGTKVVMKGIKNDYSDRFLTTSLKAGMKDKVLIDKPGELYVKGIYVKKMKSLCGYNLVMDRENPMSGDVDTEKVQSKLVNVIQSSNDMKYMERLLEGVKLANTTGKTDMMEFQCGQWAGWHMDYQKRWKTAVKKAFGTTKVCYSTSLDHSREARYKNWIVITTTIPFVKGFLKRDSHVVRLPAPKKSEKRRGMNKMDSVEKKNIRWVRKVVEGAMNTTVKDFRIVQFMGTESSIEGKAKFNTHIKISEKVLKNKERLLEVMMHEMVHYLWGYGDLTHEFQEGLGKVAAKVVLHLAKTKGKVGRGKSQSSGITPEDKEKVLDHVRILYKDDGEDEVRSWCHRNGKDVVKITSALGINTVGMKKHERIDEIVRLLEMT